MEQINKFGAQQMGTVQTMAAKSDFPNWKKGEKTKQEQWSPNGIKFYLNCTLK